MGLVIGIDLGTSTTEAAVYRNGAKEMILNMEGLPVTPSVVGIDDSGNWVAGERAKAQYLLAPERTAIEVKRKTGTGETVTLGAVRYSPAELQSRLLSYIRTCASAYLGEDVDRAVISVPAYFNELQRRETIRAGQLAGFSVERILNEPTAAALSYGLDHMEEESHVLVYDLGGGTFDVTLLEMFDGVLEVKASSGDNRLGGKDFDEKLMDHLLERFREKHHRDLRTDPYAMVRIKAEAERCKLILSEAESCHVLIPAVCTVKGAPVELDETVTRRQFEEMARDLLRRTHGPIDTVLEDAGLTERDLDRVILVGGSTRMPMVVRDIADYLDIEPDTAVHPDYAVAEGAAIQAAMISGEIDTEEGLIMTDVCPFSLGVRVTEDWDHDRMSVVIPRNVTIPTTRKERYYTQSNGQTAADVEVYQGESMIATHNSLLGHFRLGGIPPARAGKEALEVSFSYDLNGILKVTATVVSTGADASIEIDLAGEPEEAPDLSAWKDAPGARACRSVIRSAERLLNRTGDGIPSLMQDRISEALDELKQALIRDDTEEIAEAEESLRELLQAAKA